MMDRILAFQIPPVIAASIMVGVTVHTGAVWRAAGLGTAIIVMVIAMALTMHDRHNWVCKVHADAQVKRIRVTIPFWGRSVYALSASGVATLELVLSQSDRLFVKETQEVASSAILARHLAVPY